MTPTKLLIALAGSCVALSAFTSAKSPAPDSPPEPYELKNRSSFRADPEARTPFWPIGWQKPAKNAAPQVQAKAAEPAIQLLPSHFNVSSILLGNPALATINGRSFGEGELLPVVAGTQRLRVVVRAGSAVSVGVLAPELGSARVTGQFTRPDNGLLDGTRVRLVSERESYETVLADGSFSGGTRARPRGPCPC